MIVFLSFITNLRFKIDHLLHCVLRYFNKLISISVSVGEFFNWDFVKCLSPMEKAEGKECTINSTLTTSFFPTTKSMRYK